MRAARTALALAVCVWVVGCTSAEPPVETERIAPLLPGLGDHHFEISTESEEAQEFFDQGMVLAYGFNHAEAARSFEQAQLLDPECAMCFWGEALVLGPNINAPMSDDAVPTAWAALSRARELAGGASAKGAALIEALGSRYTSEVPEDRSQLDVDYAQAMRKVFEAYPDDTDVATLYAEAIMDTTPWDYWREDGEPKPELEDVLAALEPIFETEPEHPGANHLYIHAVELGRPEEGVAAAERLAVTVPGAGHLVHMPSHIYIRVGRYLEAAEANKLAVQADEDYITACRKQGLYPLAYMPHNRHFLWASATLAGQSEVALTAAREMAERQDQEVMRMDGMAMVQHFWVSPMYGLVRFGRWDEVLEQPEPAEDLTYPRGVWHYGRAIALARLDRLEEAEAELESLKEFADRAAEEEVLIFGINSTGAVLAVAREVAGGEVALARGEVDKGLSLLRLAVENEDALYYDEPASWHHPVRQILGAALMEQGRPTEAEEVYLEDLEEYPNNGWALFGLRESLIAQGKNEEASAVDLRFQEAWRQADVTLAASRF